MELQTIASLALAGLGWVSGTAVGGALGNASDRLSCVVLRGIRDRIAGLQNLPENHDVARAVRTAQIQALEQLLRDYKASVGPGSIAAPELFFDRALAFCSRTIGRCRDVSVKFNLQLSAPLMSAFDVILSEPPRDGLVSERAKAAGTLAEDAVLNELAEVLGDVGIPDDFIVNFRQGAGGRPPFLEIFGAYVAEQIKHNEPFRAMFITGKLSHLESIGIQTTTLLSGIEEQFGKSLEDIRDTQDFHTKLMASIAEDIALLKSVGSSTTSTSVRKDSVYIFHLGELIETTYTQVQLARFEATGPATLAAGLTDANEAVATIWDVATEVSRLSQRQAADLTSLCGLVSKHPVDYAVFVASAPLYDTWSKIRLIENHLALPPTFTDETFALRDLSFKALASDVRSIASRVIDERAPQSGRCFYRLDESYRALSVSLADARSLAEASTFLVGAALARMEGAAEIATKLLEINREHPTLMNTAVVKVLEPIEVAAETIRNHMASLRVTNGSFVGPPWRDLETVPRIAQVRELHREWRKVILQSLQQQAA